MSRLRISVFIKALHRVPFHLFLNCIHVLISSFELKVPTCQSLCCYWSSIHRRTGFTSFNMRVVHVPVKVVFFYRFAMLLLLDAARAPGALACLEIRSRNEEKIYLLKVFCFLLYRRQAFFRIFTFYLFLN